MIFPTFVRQQQAEHPLCRYVHPTHIGISSSTDNHTNRPDGEDTHILILCINGSGYVSSASKTTIVPAGHLLLVPSGVPHEYGSSATQSWTINWVHFSGELSEHYFHKTTQGICVAPIGSGVHDRILGLYQELFQCVNSSFEIHNLIHASQVLAHLLSMLFLVPDSSRGVSNVSSQAIKTMKENINTPLTLEDFARDAGLSRPYFSVVFKKETGFSPIDYFNHLKMRRACRLLDDPSHNIGEVGRRVGIESIHYFSRLFSKIMGLSPTAYRKLPSG